MLSNSDAPMPTAERAAPGRPRKLSPEEIVDRAIALVEKDGPQALTMRALGKALRVQASTIYNYFPSIAALNEDISRRLLATVPLPGSMAGVDARAQLLTHFMAMRTVLARHPQVLDQVPGSASWIWSLRRLEGELALLSDAGVDPETAIMAVSVLDVMCSASAQLAREWNANQWVSRRKRLFTGMQASELPHIQAVHERLIANLPDEQTFRATLETLIDSLLPQLRSRRRKS
ncbi:MAG TPA: helix-turn-helix domain-containing protein [Fontimonas sp.]